ncbi:hypothetical protein [Flavobacterium sp. CAN_S2]
MENLESEVYVTSTSHCRVGKITAKKYIDESQLTPEKDFQK